MEITLQEIGGGIAVLHPVGRLNMVSASRLRDSVAAAVARGDTRIAIDLSEVDFMDSSGLGAIIGALKTVRQEGGDLRIAAPSWQVQLVLQLTNMDRVLIAHDNAETAFADE
jgi:anti-sigma B factor antagonist